MKNIFWRFLISSDPFISSCRKLPNKPLKSLSSEVISLLSSHSVVMVESLAKEQFETDSEPTTDASALGLADYSDEEGAFFL